MNFTPRLGYTFGFHACWAFVYGRFPTAQPNARTGERAFARSIHRTMARALVRDNGYVFVLW
jgi:hypothetical protein